MDRMTHHHFRTSEEGYPIANAEVILHEREQWNEFHELDTEMVITKTGRRMFPTIKCDVKNLDPQANYCAFIEIDLAATCRNKYCPSVGWTPAGNEEAQSSQRLYMHTQSPATGQHWMSQLVSFEKLKLTNSCSPPQGQIVLSSMHRYQPKIVFAKTSHPESIRWAPKKQFVFAVTQFIAVTAYQNKRVTKLKIARNQFAKGFRENGKSSQKRRSQKRKSESISSNSSDDSEQEIDVVEMDEPSPSKPQRSRSKSPEAVVERRAGPVAPPMAPMHFDYRYYVPAPFYPSFYSPPMWVPPPMLYYPPQHCFMQRQEEVLPLAQIARENQEDEPMRLTDFSIRAITGLS